MLCACCVQALEQSIRSRGACDAPGVFPRCAAFATLRMTRAPRNCFQPGWRCGVFSALSQAPSACWALRSQRAHVCSRASRFGRALRFCSARRGLGAAPGPRSLGEMRAGIAAAGIAPRTKALHAQLQRRCVGRTDPIAPCNGDGPKLNRAASQSDRGAQDFAHAIGLARVCACAMLESAARYPRFRRRRARPSSFQDAPALRWRLHAWRRNWRRAPLPARP